MKTETTNARKLQRVLYFVCQLERWREASNPRWDGRPRLDPRRQPESDEPDPSLLFSTN
jgi:hypothetical protein